MKITFLPDQLSVAVRPGTTVLAAAQRAGVRISQRCAGKAACLMCKIHPLSEIGLSRPDPKEYHKIGSFIDDGIRLACQTRVTGDAQVRVPEDRLKALIRAQLEGDNDDGDR